MLLFFNTVLFAQNNDFNNGGADGGLWSNSANWTLGITPTSVHTVRTANSATSFVDANFTVFRLQNLNSTDTDRFVNSSSGGILTIDQNNPTASTAIAIQNVSANGVKLGLRGRINIQNAAGATAFSRITNANNAANSIEFENTSILTLTTPLEVFKASATTAANNFFFNGKIEGSGNFRVAANTTATFGNSVTNAGYTGELVLLGGASFIVNTTDDIIFYDGLKIQVNGNASTTLNGANVFASGIVVGGTNTFNFNINKNQSSMTNIIFQGAGTLNLAIGAGVTNLSFADNKASTWEAGSTLNITNYSEGVVRFGTDNTGLTVDQLSKIVVDGSGGPVALNSSGFLVNASSLSIDDFEEKTIKPIAYPTLTSDKLYFNTPQNNVKIFSLNGQILEHNTSNNQSEIGVEFLSAGLYLIVFDNLKVEKFLKK